jgi:hypothetical protein
MIFAHCFTSGNKKFEEEKNSMLWKMTEEVKSTRESESHWNLATSFFRVRGGKIQLSSPPSGVLYKEIKMQIPNNVHRRVCCLEVCNLSLDYSNLVFFLSETDVFVLLVDVVCSTSNLP